MEAGFSCMNCLSAEARYRFGPLYYCESCLDTNIADSLLDQVNDGEFQILNPDGRIFTEAVPKIRDGLVADLGIDLQGRE